MPKIIIEIGKGQNADQVLASLKAQLGNLADGATVLADNTRKIEREQRQAETAFRRTAASLDPAIAKSQEYSKAQQTLGEALKRNLVTQEEHDRLLSLARERSAEASGALTGLLERYATGATVIAAFTFAVSGSLAVLQQVSEFVSGSVAAAADSERVQAQLGARIASTGGAAELTASQLAEMGNELQNVSKFSDEVIGSAENILLTFTSISGDTFRGALSAVTDMSTALGTDMVSNARLVGKALEDPVKGMQALARAGVVFTAGEKEVIKSLVESGNLLAAQDRLLAALSSRYGGAAAADVATFGGSLDRVNNLWDNFMEKVGEGVLPILSTFFTQVGNIIVGNEELAQTLGILVTQGGRVAAVFVSAGADGARAFLEMASTIMGALASIAEGAADVAEFMNLDTLADGLREAADGQRQNAAIGSSLAAAAGQVSDAAFLAAIALEKEGEAAATGAKSSRDHAAGDEEAAKAAAKFSKELQGLVEQFDPMAAAEREAAEGLKILEEAMERYPERAEEWIRLQAQIIDQLNATRRAAELVANDLPQIPVERNFGGILFIGDQIEEELRRNPPEIPYFEISGGMTQLEQDFEASSQQFSENMEAGLVSAGETFLMELMQGGDDAWEHLGQNLTEVLLQSVSEWLVAQLAAIAKAAVAAQSIQAGGGGYGSAENFVGPAMQSGALGTSGSGMGAAASVGWAVVAVAAVIAISKYIKDQHDAKQYGTEVRVDNVGESNWIHGQVRGRLHETGGYIADGIESMLHAIESAAGILIEDLPAIQIKIRNDKERFSVWIAGEFVGHFKSAQEAMMAAVTQAFRTAEFEGQLAPELRSVIENFRGSDPEELIQALQRVRGVMDEVAGLTQIEVDIRGLDNAAQALQAELYGLGVAFTDARNLAEQWKLTQLQSLRDQITGHQQTVAEQRAEFERQRAMFNAKLVLEKLDLQMQRDAVAAKILIVEAGGQLLSADLISMANYLGTKAEIYGQSWSLEEANLEALAAANNISIEILRAQLAALDAAMAALGQIAPIDAGEFRPRGGGRGGGRSVNVDTGPSPAEQRALDFEEFLRNEALAGLSDLQRQLADVNLAYEEQALAASEVEGGEERLAAAREAALARLREGLIDGLGLPLEALRDRLENLQEVMDYLRLTTDRTADSSARYQQVFLELTGQMSGELLGIAASLADAFGMDAEAAEFRAMAAEIEYDIQVMQFQMLYRQLQALGGLTSEQEQRFKDFELYLQTHRPDFGGAGAGDTDGGGYNNGQDDALDAMNALTDALNDLADLQRDLWASDLSPLNAEQQTNFLRDQLQEAYAQAQGSRDPADIRAFQDLVRDYLSSYQDAYGSTGGYTAEFLRINELINNLLAMGGIGGVVPGPGWPGGPAGTGSTGWRPTPGGQGTVLPFERSGGPGSPFVVESPSIVALLQQNNQRLQAVEAALAGLGGELRTANLQNGTQAFLGARSRNPVGLEGDPRRQRRGA